MKIKFLIISCKPIWRYKDNNIDAIWYKARANKMIISKFCLSEILAWQYQIFNILVAEVQVWDIYGFRHKIGCCWESPEGVAFHFPHNWNEGPGQPELFRHSGVTQERRMDHPRFGSRIPGYLPKQFGCLCILCIFPSFDFKSVELLH